MSATQWRSRYYDRVDETYDTERAARMRGKSSVLHYVRIKSWGRNPANYAAFRGEEDRVGQYVPERYLDDRGDQLGTRLKLVCRLACLPLMARVGREVSPQWPKERRVCFRCDSGEVEDIDHFVMRCDATAKHRLACTVRVRATLRTCTSLSTADFDSLTEVDRLHVLLGRRFGDPGAEDRVDTIVKKFLRKCWASRTQLTLSINELFGTHYDCTVSPRG
jgi:hypothetical protein